MVIQDLYTRYQQDSFFFFFFFFLFLWGVYCTWGAEGAMKMWGGQLTRGGVVDRLHIMGWF